jgi:hypothetical protein
MTIERAILTALGRQPRNVMLPETTLCAEVALIMGDAPMPSALKTALRTLDGSREAIGIANREVGMRWVITDAGRATLAEL